MKSKQTDQQAMTSFFHFIRPGEIVDPDKVAAQLDAGQLGVESSIFDAIYLADSAAAFFRGIFPFESPHFWWGSSLSLPWQREYFSGDGPMFSHRQILAECTSIAGELTRIDIDNEDPWPQITYQCAALNASPKLVVQGLATEALLSVDGFLIRIAAGSLPESLRWLTAGYKNLMECMCVAQEVLGIASENAKKAAHARHREDHQMKEQVWQWYGANKDKFDSMDKAAEAVVGSEKLVPIAFRTARAWIREWERKRSARRP